MPDIVASVVSELRAESARAERWHTIERTRLFLGAPAVVSIRPCHVPFQGFAMPMFPI